MTIGDILTHVKEELNKGDALTDAQILRYIRQAIRILEMKYDWDFLEKKLDVELAANALSLTLPDRVKRIRNFILQTPQPAGDLYYLKKKDSVHPASTTAYIQPDRNESYLYYTILGGTPSLVTFETPFSVAVSCAVYYDQYTDTPALVEASTSSLSTLYPDLLLASVFVAIAPFVREFELGTYYQGIAADLLNTAMLEQLNNENSNTPARLNYGRVN